MKKIMGIILSMGIVGVAHGMNWDVGENKVFHQHMDMCEELANTADVVMSTRQTGIHKEIQLEIINARLEVAKEEFIDLNGKISPEVEINLQNRKEIMTSIVNEAYSVPMVMDRWEQNQIVMNYKIWWFLRCGESFGR